MRDLAVVLLMILATYRFTRLVIKDTFPPVLWLRDRLAGGWRPLTGQERGDLQKLQVEERSRLRDIWRVTIFDGVEKRYVYRWKLSPEWLAELMTCPWCASGWLAGAVTLATDLTVGIPVPWLVGPAVWAGAAWLASRDWT